MRREHSLIEAIVISFTLSYAHRMRRGDYGMASDTAVVSYEGDDPYLGCNEGFRDA